MADYTREVKDQLKNAGFSRIRNPSGSHEIWGKAGEKNVVVPSKLKKQTHRKWDYETGRDTKEILNLILPVRKIQTKDSPESGPQGRNAGNSGKGPVCRRSPSPRSTGMAIVGDGVVVHEISTDHPGDGIAHLNTGS